MPSCSDEKVEESSAAETDRGTGRKNGSVVACWLRLVLRRIWEPVEVEQNTEDGTLKEVAVAEAAPARYPRSCAMKRIEAEDASIERRA